MPAVTVICLLTHEKKLDLCAAECLGWVTEVEAEDDRRAFLDMSRDWTLAGMRLEGTLIPSGEQQSQPLSGATENSK
jgi:hypothetical protein